MRIFQKQDLIIYLLTVFLTSCNSTIRETGTDSSGDTIPTAKKPGLSQLSDRIRKNPLNAANFAERSRLYFELDNVDEAINDLEIAVKLDSMKPEYYIDLAEYNIYNRKPGAAKDKLEKCISIFPENTEAILKLAELHLYIKQYKESMQLLQTVQKIDKHIAYIYYLKGIIFKETGDTVKAIENFQIAIDKEPDFYNIHILLGKIYADRNDSIAIAYYKNAIRIIPGSIEAHYDLGIYYQEAGRAADAINEYEYIIENIDSAYPYAYHNIGFIYMEHFCNFEKAIAYFDKSAMLAPDYVEAVYHRGLCYETMQQYEKARADYRRTLDIVPNYRYGIDGLNRIDDKLH